jgi:hypothetical protein
MRIIILVLLLNYPVTSTNKKGACRSSNSSINGFLSAINSPLLQLLHGLVRSSDLLSVVQSHDDGVVLYDSVKAAGLEGIVSKRRNSRYVLDEAILVILH